MLRKFVSACVTPVSSSWRVSASRGLCSTSGKGDDKDKKSKEPTVKEALGDDLLDAVNAVADSLHSTSVDDKKKTKNSLLAKLMDVEKTTFQSATKVQTEEMLSDKSVLSLLQDVAVDSTGTKPVRAVAQRQARRGLLLLRKEIFYQAVQDGIPAAEATQIAEKAVAEAEQRLAVQRREGAVEAGKERVEETERDEKQKKLFDYAFQMAEKMLYKEDQEQVVDSRKTIRPDPKAELLFQKQTKLGVFESLDSLKDHQLGFWAEWDKRAAVIGNQSLGPENAFEEQINWTQQGKQWPYPIDNEWQLGEESEVPFFEHVFLERHLAKLGMPREGPIAHFLELVCVGLSKNSYMSAAKKREHLEWFANYFNEEKQKLVDKLHEQELQAAANA